MSLISLDRVLERLCVSGEGRTVSGCGGGCWGLELGLVLGLVVFEDILGSSYVLS